jgi:hypothetical protein
MNSEVNMIETGGTPGMGKQGTLILDGSEVRAMRHRLHELANVFTGVMIAGGLLSQCMKGGSLRSYVTDICDGSERGAALVREIRSQLLTASGELEAGGQPKLDEAAHKEQGIS